MKGGTNVRTNAAVTAERPLYNVESLTPRRSAPPSLREVAVYGQVSRLRLQSMVLHVSNTTITSSPSCSSFPSFSSIIPSCLGPFSGCGFCIFYLKLSIFLAAAFHVSTTRQEMLQSTSDLGGLFQKDESNGIWPRVWKLGDRILFSEKDFAHAVRKLSHSFVPNKRMPISYFFSGLEVSN